MYHAEVHGLELNYTYAIYIFGYQCYHLAIHGSRVGSINRAELIYI